LSRRIGQTVNSLALGASIPILETSRLRYERILQRHAAELQNVLCDPRVYACVDSPCPTPEQFDASFVRKEAGAPASRADECWLDYAVRHIESGEAIGCLEATIIGNHAELGYFLGPDFWGQGYAREGLTWLEDFLNGTHGISEFWAAVRPDNVRSIKLLERAGYREATAGSWSHLTSYDPGDRVFHRLAQSRDRTG
jgi:RimJ/RimL family protein N-acetyltransferase